MREYLRHSKIEAVRLLIDLGADWSAKNEFGNTLLHEAARNGEMKTVKFLIDSGAELMARNWDGDTSLCLARRSGHSAVVKYLVYQRDMRIGQNRFVWEE